MRLPDVPLRTWSLATAAASATGIAAVFGVGAFLLLALRTDDAGYRGYFVAVVTTFVGFGSLGAVLAAFCIPGEARLLLDKHALALGPLAMRAYRGFGLRAVAILLGAQVVSLASVLTEPALASSVAVVVVLVVIPLMVAAWLRVATGRITAG